MPVKFWLGTKTYVQQFITKRKGETKFGETIQYLDPSKNIEAVLESHLSPYVLLGIPEDMGVYANFGRRGARHSFDVVMQYLCNMQHNSFQQGDKILFLGRISFEKSDYDFIDDASLSDGKKIKKSRELVAALDKKVAYYASLVAKANKKLIVVGGGHNNCYGLLKGYALGKNQSMNVVNVDAHADLRATEGRHSGNGFTYAHKEGFIKQYTVLGLNESYIDPHAFMYLEQHSKTFTSITFEDVFVRKSISLKKAIRKIVEKHQEQMLGLELDMDVVANYPSSAVSAEGILPRELRQVVYQLNLGCNLNYMHICETRIQKKREVSNAKLIALLITDFIKN